MSDSILLHESKGVNPHMTTCTQCGKPSEHIVLFGARDHVVECLKCGFKYYGVMAVKRRVVHCENCKSTNTRVREIYDSETVPDGLCRHCEKLKKAADDMVKAGGIHWRCKVCGSAGAIAGTHELAKRVREHMKIPDGPCGVEFDKEQCPVCNEAAQ